MFGYWIKKRLLLSIIYSLIIATAYIVAFVVPYAKNYSENDLKKRATFLMTFLHQLSLN